MGCKDFGFWILDLPGEYRQEIEDFGFTMQGFL
jgi:hypothetical protein